MTIIRFNYTMDGKARPRAPQVLIVDFVEGAPTICMYTGMYTAHEVRDMPKQSAGLLMYRRTGQDIEVLLVHPGGPFWAKKDLGAWSIPKGEFTADEDPLAAAQREFGEETGMRPDGPFARLVPIRQPSGKTIHAWAFEGNCDADAIRSNSFSMEWPPRSGRQQEFPEVDRAGWFTVDVAKEKIIKGQLGFIEELARLAQQDS
jgi:predicted NUDIX family NTP pyrophosphohydrolase